MQLELGSASPLLFAAAMGDAGERAPGSDRSEGGGLISPRVLIVEDEGLVALNMEQALVDAGFQIVGIVDTEADAVEMARRLKPDVVLMDITLREGNGISAAESIHELLKTTCVVFISGNSDPRTVAAIERTSAAGLIRKPFLTERLPDLVREIIRLKPV